MSRLPLGQVYKSRWRQRLRELANDQTGATFAFAAIGMTAMIGFAGIGIDLSHWYSERRLTQNMADAAALAAVYAQLAGQQDLLGEAQTEAVRNGYTVAAGNSITVTPQGGTNNAVEVVVRRLEPLYFASVVIDPVTIPARAVAGTRIIGTGTQCVIALDQTASRAVEFTGTTVADIGCGVASNSNSSEAIYVGGNAYLRANPAQAVGDIVVSGDGELVSDEPLLPYSPAQADPYRDLTIPTRTGTCHNSGVTVNSNNSATLNAGDHGGVMNICGNLDVRGSLNLEPGTYIIDGGNVDFSSQSVVVGDGVTIVITGETPSDIGTIRINGGAEVQLTAPTSGDLQGVIIAQDRRAPVGNDSRLNGGATMELLGAAYLPRAAVTVNGGNSNVGCTQVIANTVSFSGTSYIRNDETACQALGVVSGTQVAQQIVVLLE